MNRRKDGRLEKTITLDGKRIHVYGHSQAEIKQKIDSLYRDLYDGALGIDRQTKFKDYAAHYLEVALIGKTDRTITSYTLATKHLVEELGEKPLCNIKRSQIEEALNNHADTPTMRNKMLMCCRAIYNMAIDDGLVTSNPAANIKKVRHEHRQKDRFTSRENDIIKNTPLEPRERVIIDILYNTGIRKGELLGLSRKSIDNGVIHITEQSALDKNGRPVIEKPKTKASVRDIPIPEWLEKEIRAYMKTVDSIYIFESIRGKHSFMYVWAKILMAFSKYNNPKYIPKAVRSVKMSEIPIQISPHWFRHNFASILHDKGVDVLIAQAVLGHSSVATTLDIYTHLDKGTKEDKFEEVRKLFAI